MTSEESVLLAGVRILIVDDEEDIRLGLRRLLSRFGAEIAEAADGVDALCMAKQEPFDLVLTDLMMPHMSGEDLLRKLKALRPDTEVVIFTGYGSIRTAVQCLRDGAAHFLTKPFDNDEICRLVTRLGQQRLALRAPRREAQGAFIVEDPRMRGVLELVDRVAKSPLPVLIEGESGTGKEILARTVHERSTVAGRPFQAVNSAALPDTLLESELFGHKKGAFTGADGDRDGLFVAAAGGTVFLDEVASMSLAFQVKLLRVLQEKRVRPLGAVGDVSVAFRLVAATNRDLEALCDDGLFRRDLFYRLGVVRIHVPPLRERPLDVLPLARHFLEAAARLCGAETAELPGISDEATQALCAHRWPGNVRELENAVQRAVIVCPGRQIEAHHLGLDPPKWAGPREQGREADAIDYNAGKQAAILRFQREYVQRALERTQGNISRAADSCGMTRAALQRILRQLGIDRTAFNDA